MASQLPGPRAREHIAPPGASLLGLVLSTFIYGIITVQTAKYISTFRQDRLVNWLAVNFVFVISTFQVACMTSAIYVYLLHPDFKDPEIPCIMWRFIIPLVADMITGFVVLSALVYSVYHLSKCRGGTIALEIMIILRTGMGGKMIADRWKNMLQEVPSVLTFSWIFVVSAILTVTTDVCVCGSLCWVLLRNRTGNHAGDAGIVRMVRYMVPSCLLLCVWEVARAASILARSSWGVLFAGVPLGPVFNFVFLALLHARSRLTYTTDRGDWTLSAHAFGESSRRRPVTNNNNNTAYTVSIVKETVQQSCDQGAREMELITRLEKKFPDEPEVQSYYPEEAEVEDDGEITEQDVTSSSSRHHHQLQ